MGTIIATVSVRFWYAGKQILVTLSPTIMPGEDPRVSVVMEIVPDTGEDVQCHFGEPTVAITHRVMASDDQLLPPLPEILGVTTSSGICQDIRWID